MQGELKNALENVAEWVAKYLADICLLQEIDVLGFFRVVDYVGNGCNG